MKSEKYLLRICHVSVLLFNSLWVIMRMAAMITSTVQLIREYNSVYKALFKPGKHSLKIIAWEGWFQTRGGMVLDSNLSVETIRFKACDCFSWAVKRMEILMYICKSFSSSIFRMGGLLHHWAKILSKHTGLGTIKNPENWVRHLPLAKSLLNKWVPWVAASRWSVRTRNERNFQVMALPREYSASYF